MSLQSTSNAVLGIRIASPVVAILAVLALLFARGTSATQRSQSPITQVVVANRIPRRAAILSLLSLISVTYLLDGIAFAVYAVIGKHWQHNTGIEVNAICGLVAFAGMAAVGAIREVQGVSVWFLKRVKTGVTVSTGLDIALVVLLGLATPIIGRDRPQIPEQPRRISIPDLVHLALPAFRVLLLLPLLGCLLFPRTVYNTISVEEDSEPPSDSSFLLPPGSVNTPSANNRLSTDNSKYGTFRQHRSLLQNSNPGTRLPSPSPSTVAAEPKPDGKPEISLDPSWKEIMQRFKHITPYLWPSKSKKLQLVAAACILLLILGRFVNFAGPYLLAKLVNTFEDGSAGDPWIYLSGYVVVRFLQGSGGLSALRDALWTPVMQYSDREMSLLSFDHILSLSFAWHTRRKTGEVLRILDRGAAINRTLELILFNIIPTFIDIAVAVVVFCLYFEWVLGVMIFFVIAAYVAASVIMTRWRTKIRRRMNERDIITRGIHTDCLLNYETVKYFGGEEHENGRYTDAINQYQALEYRVILSLNTLNLVQNFIITLGLLIGALIVAFRVTTGKSNTGDFVFFVTYIQQLYGPLNQLGSTYRSINQSLIDTEKLLALLNEPTEVNDVPNAPDLVVSGGEIEFDNVSFSYDGRNTALNGISFKVPKGSSVALVGDSGSGKSTILRLLYRFYDLGTGNGRILIDGQNIKDVTQKSLRQSIGVVPQDSVLFNTSISYNISYGKFGASPEEIEMAARSAQMHDRIMSFPDGYDTKVGERGVRLSGGEKQRVSIARTLLKNPPVLLLDEATSALDTSTEKDIQKAIQNLVQGRSSLSIAHRLSTIASADLILVLKDGHIVERGTHKELLALDGVFASMWADQVSATEEAAPPSMSDKAVGKEPSSSSIGGGSQAPQKETESTAIVPSSSTSQNEQPTAEEPPVVESPTQNEPPSQGIAFPSGDSEPASPMSPEAPASPAPVVFPTQEPDQPQEPDSPQPGVTFEETASPSGGDADPSTEPKRKRISSQNFQRLAKKVSNAGRRQSNASGIFSGLGKSKDKDREASPRASADDSSARGDKTGSPSPSVTGDKKSKKSKKDKKKKDSTSTA